MTEPRKSRSRRIPRSKVTSPETPANRGGDLEEKLRRAVSTNAKFSNKTGRLNKEIRNLKEERDRLTEQVTALSGRVTELETTNETQTARITELETDVAGKTTELGTAQSENEALRNDNEILTTTTETQTARITELEASLAEKEDQIAKLREELATERASSVENTTHLETVCLVLARAHLATNDGTGRPKLGTAVRFIEEAGANNALVVTSAALRFFTGALEERANGNGSLTTLTETPESETAAATLAFASQK